MAGTERTIGLAGATAIGVGAIVGGGVLALAGTALAVSGPGALLAFALNGVIAIITALSFAELSGRFPRSGGTYTFARTVLSVEAAFVVGWVVWFASIVAAVLYAAGFAAFAVPVIRQLWIAVDGQPPEWLEGRTVGLLLAMGATAAYAAYTAWRSASGGAFLNVAKLVVFAVLIGGGLWALGGTPSETISQSLTPFLSAGVPGLLQAMGFTFIALQGFDLIAAVAGEVKDPAKTIPRAMLLSLGIALVVYLPLLFLVSTVGVDPSTTITALSAEHPETVIAIAAGRFIGPAGYWLVMAAGLLAMLSALQANLFAASRVAQAMASDHTLPSILERVSSRRTPVNAVAVTGLITIVVLVVLPDVASAGAAASLIFLCTFAFAHVICLLARRRAGDHEEAFHVPGAPYTQIFGGVVCMALAAFQAVAVPDAGLIAVIWLGIGAVLFLTLFAHRARVRDAASEATDPHLQRLRGRRPLVLVPLANPKHAGAMVEVANALAARGIGRVLLLNIVTRLGEGDGADAEQKDRWSLVAAQTVLREAMLESLGQDRPPEALMATGDNIWTEIERVAHVHACESLVVGLSDLESYERGSPLESMLSRVPCDAVVLRAPDDWKLSSVQRILVAIGGANHHDILRARLLSSIRRRTEREVTYLRAIRPDTSVNRRAILQRSMERLVRDEMDGRAVIMLKETDEPIETIVDQARHHDLVILGMQQDRRRNRVIGDVAKEIARRTDCGIIMISRRS